MTDPGSDKQDVRHRVLAARRARRPQALQAVGDALAAHLAGDVALGRAQRLAAYLAMPGEPPTAPLLADRLAAGCEVIVPVARDDRGLDWVAYQPDAPTLRSSLGIDEPTGEPLAGAPLAEVDLVLVPALAVDHVGHRLGRGAGYYDRALSRFGRGPGRPLVCAVVFADELVPDLPHEPHDVPVDLVLTEAGVFRPLPR